MKNACTAQPSGSLFGSRTFLASSAPALRAEFDFYEPEHGMPGEDEMDDDADDLDLDDTEADDIDEDDEDVRDLVAPGEHQTDDE